MTDDKLTTTDPGELVSFGEVHRDDGASQDARPERSFGHRRHQRGRSRSCRASASRRGSARQMVPNDTLYIKDLTMFDMFNDMTNEIYGKGPITIVPIMRDVRRIEFTPRSEGGGVVDLDVPKGDPRMQWTWSTPELQASKAKADVPPAATEFIEFVLMLLRPGKAPQPIMFSIAQKNKWNRRAADKITSTVKLRHAPIYANLFSVDTHIPGQNDKGTFGVPTIRDLGSSRRTPRPARRSTSSSRNSTTRSRARRSSWSEPMT